MMNIGPFLIMFAASLWAVDALIRTPLTKSISAAGIVFLEHLIGFMLLTPFLVKSRDFYRKLKFSDWLVILSLTTLSSVAGTILFTMALTKSFATGDFITPLLLQKIQPVFVIFLSTLFLKEKITMDYLVLAPLAILGSYLMSFGFMPVSLELTNKLVVYLLALGAAFSWGSGTILSKKILKKLTYLELTGIRFLMAIPVGFLAMYLWNQTVNISTVTTEHIFRFILIGLTTGAGALLIYYRGLAKTEAKISTISELTFPLISILIGITSLNPYGQPQKLGTPNIIGILILVFSVLVISYRYARTSKSP